MYHMPQPFSLYFKKNPPFALAILCAMMLAISTLNAQQPNLTFSHYSIKNGLPHNNVNAIIQDYKGFMWFGTENGLTRYDGYSSVVYQHHPGVENSVSGNTVYSLLEDHSRNIWICTSTGLNRYNRASDSFEEYPFYVTKEEEALLSGPDTIIYNQYFKNIYETSNHQLLVISTNERRIGYIDTLQKRILPYHFPNLGSVFQSVVQNPQAMFIDTNGDYWIGNKQTVCVYDPNQKQMVREIQLTQSDNTIRSICQVNTQIWIGTTTGVYAFDTRDQKLTHYQHQPNNPFSLPTNNIHKMYNDASGNIWIGSDSEGLSMFIPEKKEFITYQYNFKDPQTICGNTVNAIYRDRQNILWIGTMASGISYALPNNLFDVVYYAKLDGKGLFVPCAQVACSLKDNDGNTWMGLDCAGIVKINHKTGEYTQFYSESPPSRRIGGNKILSITQDQDGMIWAGGYYSGLNLINPKTNTVIKTWFPDKTNQSYNHDDIRHIYCDRNNNLWLATNGGGINYFDRKNQRFTYLKYHPDAPLLYLASDNCLTINESTTGELYFGTYFGLSVYNRNTGKFRNHYFSSDSLSLSNNWVYSLCPDDNGNMWVGTFSGLNYFDSKTDRFKRYGNDAGFPNNTINGILSDDAGYLWISTDNSLCKFNPVSEQVTKAFSSRNGLFYTQFLHGSASKGADSILNFGTAEGLVSFNPNRIATNTEKTLVYFTALLLNHMEVNPGPNSVLTNQMLMTDRIVMNHNQARNFTIRFTGINSIYAETNQFKYILENFDSDWSSVGNKREATYTNLDAGVYLFKVKASNSDGLWNDDEAVLTIVILPPWWQTWWFKAIFIICIIVIIWQLFSLRMKILRSRADELKKMVDVKTSQLLMANEELQTRNIRIIEQNEEIRAQNEDIRSKTDEIMTQNEHLEHQNHRLEITQTELIHYRDQLEERIKERTQELIIAKNNAEEANHLKNAFLQNMSHEIRTPLNAVVGFSRLMASGIIEENEMDQMASIIESNSNALLSLIEDIIDFSNLKTGNYQLHYQPVNLTAFCREFKTAINQEFISQSVTKSKNIILTFKPDKQIENTTLYTDVSRLNQILLNLFNNALKYTNEGSIEIGCGFQDQSQAVLRFYVKDTGIGIPMDKLEFIFNTFGKLDIDKKTVYRGIGLGLSLCKTLVNILGGEIWVVSTPEMGSIFYFTLPVVQESGN